MGGRGRGGYRGGNKRGRTLRRDFKDGRPNVWKKPRPQGEGAAPSSSGRPGWDTFIMESPAFETYYKKQQIVPPEEWSTFIEILRKPLPTSFRINGSGQFAQNIRDQMQHDFFDVLKEGIEVDGELLEPIKPIAWYPDNLAWVLHASRMQLRKMPLLERIHEFLKQENEIGSITRQEAVSMIPPLLLDVQPHHRVLDMCAAPGSKTFQLLEMIHKEDIPGILPQGMVIANDLDVQRCHLLIHQTKRMCSPNILVTNHEAQHFPGLRDKAREARAQVDSNGKSIVDDENGLWFDRILCDVPCSGDGTIRKAPDIWKKWHSGLGNGVHRLQVQIAMRGVALLKVGGRLVYSTCSLNPVEDEAVVGEILRQADGSVELLDVSSEIPGLKYRPGIKTWKVRDKRKWLCASSEVDRHRAGVIVPSMFPSGKGWDLSTGLDNTEAKSKLAEEKVAGLTTVEDTQEDTEEDELEVEVGEPEVSDLPLERCMRILPHDQNSGGFFIAVFRKISPYKVQQPKSTGKQEKALKQHFMRETGTSISTIAAEGKAPSPSNIEELETSSGDGMAVDERSERTGPLASNKQELKASGYGMAVDARPNIKKSDPGPEATSNEQLRSLSEGDLNKMKALETAETLDRSNLEPSLDQTHEEMEAQGAAEAVESARNDQEGVFYQTHDEMEGQNASEALKSNLEGILDLTPDANEAEGKPSEENSSRGRVQQQGRWKGVDPVLILKDEEVLESLISYYGIKDSFPLHGHLITRSEDISRLKRIYYVSKSVRDAIELNSRTGGQLKITSAGLKIFERQAPKEGISRCAFRIASEGLPALLPHMSNQIVYANDQDFKLLLSSNAVPFGAFHDPEFARALQEVLPGCCVIILPKWKEGGEVDFTSSIAVGCWRGRSNVSLLITKTEAVQFLQRLSLPEGDSTTFHTTINKSHLPGSNTEGDCLPNSWTVVATHLPTQTEQLKE